LSTRQKYLIKLWGYSPGALAPAFVDVVDGVVDSGFDVA
jgi:hypothetical protein